MDADYSSDEADLTWSGRSRSRDHTSESAKAAKKAKQTAKAMQKDAADAADNSKGFFGEHLSQIVVAALVAGGAAAVYFLKQKSTDKTSGEKDSESATSAKPTPGRTQAADTKKPAMRRKRSE